MQWMSTDGGRSAVLLRQFTGRDGRTADHYCRCPAAPLSRFLAHDREGLILLSRDIDFLEQTLHLSRPRNLYAELRPGRRRHETLAAARRLGLPSVATNGVVAAR